MARILNGNLATSSAPVPSRVLPERLLSHPPPFSSQFVLSTFDFFSASKVLRSVALFVMKNEFMHSPQLRGVVAPKCLTGFPRRMQKKGMFPSGQLTSQISHQPPKNRKTIFCSILSCGCTTLPPSSSSKFCFPGCEGHMDLLVQFQPTSSALMDTLHRVPQSSFCRLAHASKRR